MGKSGFGHGLFLVWNYFHCRLRGPRGFTWEKAPVAGFGAGGSTQGKMPLGMQSIWGAGRFSSCCGMSRELWLGCGHGDGVESVSRN